MIKARSQNDQFRPDWHPASRPPTASSSRLRSNYFTHRTVRSRGFRHLRKKYSIGFEGRRGGTFGLPYAPIIRVSLRKSTPLSITLNGLQAFRAAYVHTNRFAMEEQAEVPEWTLPYRAAFVRSAQTILPADRVPSFQVSAFIPVTISTSISILNLRKRKSGRQIPHVVVKTLYPNFASSFPKRREVPNTSRKLGQLR